MAAEAKKTRTRALGNFTRNYNQFESMLNESSPAILVNPQYEKLKDCWESLEAAHDDFLDNTDIDIETD